MLSGAATIAKSLSKAVYVFSPDVDNGKVAHVNFIPKEVLDRKVLNAKEWLTEVSKIVGGKVILVFVYRYLANNQGGGKDDSASGVGSEIEKINEAMEAAKKVYKEKVEA